MPGKSVYLPCFESTCPIALYASKRPNMSTSHLCNQTTWRSPHKSDSKWYHSFNTIWMYVSSIITSLSLSAQQCLSQQGLFRSFPKSQQLATVFLCTSRYLFMLLPQWLLTALSAFSTQQVSQESKSFVLPHIFPHPYPICPQIC